MVWEPSTSWSVSSGGRAGGSGGSWTSRSEGAKTGWGGARGGRGGGVGDQLVDREAVGRAGGCGKKGPHGGEECILGSPGWLVLVLAVRCRINFPSLRSPDPLGPAPARSVRPVVRHPSQLVEEPRPWSARTASLWVPPAVCGGRPATPEVEGPPTAGGGDDEVERPPRPVHAQRRRHKVLLHA